VLISTDKAVKPISVMGASKWLAEQVIWSKGSSDCVFSAVRFGNVIGSRGGVVQTFLKQVADGGPVTVTDARMARYFMSIEESVRLVLQASALSWGGEVFTLEMGEPVRIADLAQEVIRLAGRVPGRDVEITMIGARPGEKLVEDLLDQDERPGPSEHDAITTSRPVPPGGQALDRVLSELRSLAEDGGEDVLADRLRALASRVRLMEVTEEVGG
jgi:FlaA1/EpsC-like NDP-sugar epimerase